jgi:hypothetical protein
VQRHSGDTHAGSKRAVKIQKYSKYHAHSCYCTAAARTVARRTHVDEAHARLAPRPQVHAPRVRVHERRPRPRQHLARVPRHGPPPRAAPRVPHRRLTPPARVQPRRDELMRAAERRSAAAASRVRLGRAGAKGDGAPRGARVEHAHAPVAAAEEEAGAGGVEGDAGRAVAARAVRQRRDLRTQAHT